MQYIHLLLLLAASHLAAAHFSIDYPYWRGDSFLPPATQWEHPCAGINQSISNNNRTKWPLTGGSVQLTVHHPWAITYINLGLGGDNTTVFNISLVAGFNQTGNGTFCIPHVLLPNDVSVAAGANASVQVVQIGETGSALYNCADITFAPDAKLLSTSLCANSTGVGGVPIVSASSPSSSSSSSNSSSNSSAAGGKSMGSGAGDGGVGKAVWVAFVALALALVVRIG